MSVTADRLPRMPSALHEAIIELFRYRPSLVPEFMELLGVKLPTYEQVALESGDLTDLVPTEYRADTVVSFTDVGAAVFAVVVEVQLGRDRGKRWSWPVYVTTLRARLRCPVLLLVVCADAATAAWCAAPIAIGHPGWDLVPLVLGPDRVPVVTNPEEARRSPELAVLSAMAHGGRGDVDGQLRAVLAALEMVDDEHAARYSDVVLAALPAAARKRLEALVTSVMYEYKSDFVRRYIMQGRAEGRAEGEAKAVLAVLAARGIEVADDARARISECTDIAQLDVWIRRAATADSIDDLFD